MSDDKKELDHYTKHLGQLDASGVPFDPEFTVSLKMRSL